MEKAYFTAEGAAEYTGLSESYLAKLRMSAGSQVGPKFLRIGVRAIRYRREDLDEWMESKSSGQPFIVGGRR